MRYNADHLRMANDPRGYEFSCRHCGKIEIVVLPISLDEMAWKAKQFLKLHKKCLPQNVETGHDLSLQTHHEKGVNP